jgi:hypothetical protein
VALTPPFPATAVDGIATKTITNSAKINLFIFFTILPPNCFAERVRAQQLIERAS